MNIREALNWLYRISVRQPNLFAHWTLLESKPRMG